jgi:four helix bundle protein
MIVDEQTVMADRMLLDFEKMEVWQDAQDLAVDVYSDFAGCRDFTFVDQIKRAAVSISNNIAEGAERATKLDFARFIDIGKGSAGEVRSMYRLAERLGFVEVEVGNKRIQRCESICRQLGGFAMHLRNK